MNKFLNVKDNYLLSNDLGIFGSSTSQTKHALVPIVADKLPNQDKNDANIFF